MEVLGVCPAQIFSTHPESLQTPGDIMKKFHNPLLQYSVAEEYCSYVLEYFSGPNIITEVSIFTWGLSRSMELTISSHHLAFR